MIIFFFANRSIQITQNKLYAIRSTKWVFYWASLRKVRLMSTSVAFLTNSELTTKQTILFAFSSLQSNQFFCYLCAKRAKVCVVWDTNISSRNKYLSIIIITTLFKYNEEASKRKWAVGYLCTSEYVYMCIATPFSTIYIFRGCRKSFSV